MHCAITSSGVVLLTMNADSTINSSRRTESDSDCLVIDLSIDPTPGLSPDMSAGLDGSMNTMCRAVDQATSTALDRGPEYPHHEADIQLVVGEDPDSVLMYGFDLHSLVAYLSLSDHQTRCADTFKTLVMDRQRHLIFTKRPDTQSFFTALKTAFHNLEHGFYREKIGVPVTVAYCSCRCEESSTFNSTMSTVFDKDALAYTFAGPESVSEIKNNARNPTASDDKSAQQRETLENVHSTGERNRLTLPDELCGFGDSEWIRHTFFPWLFRRINMSTVLETPLSQFDEMDCTLLYPLHETSSTVCGESIDHKTPSPPPPVADVQTSLEQDSTSDQLVDGLCDRLADSSFLKGAGCGITQKNARHTEGHQVRSSGESYSPNTPETRVCKFMTKSRNKGTPNQSRSADSLETPKRRFFSQRPDNDCSSNTGQRSSMGAARHNRAHCRTQVQSSGHHPGNEVDKQRDIYSFNGTFGHEDRPVVEDLQSTGRFQRRFFATGEAASGEDDAHLHDTDIHTQDSAVKSRSFDACQKRTCLNTVHQQQRGSNANYTITSLEHHMRLINCAQTTQDLTSPEKRELQEDAENSAVSHFVDESISEFNNLGNQTADAVQDSSVFCAVDNQVSLSGDPKYNSGEGMSFSTGKRGASSFNENSEDSVVLLPTSPGIEHSSPLSLMNKTYVISSNHMGSFDNNSTEREQPHEAELRSYSLIRTVPKLHKRSKSSQEIFAMPGTEVEQQNGHGHEGMSVFLTPPVPFAIPFNTIMTVPTSSSIADNDDSVAKDQERPFPKSDTAPMLEQTQAKETTRPLSFPAATPGTPFQPIASAAFNVQHQLSDLCVLPDTSVTTPGPVYQKSFPHPQRHQQVPSDTGTEGHYTVASKREQSQTCCGSDTPVFCPTKQAPRQRLLSLPKAESTRLDFSIDSLLNNTSPHPGQVKTQQQTRITTESPLPASQHYPKQSMNQQQANDGIINPPLPRNSISSSTYGFCSPILHMERPSASTPRVSTPKQVRFQLPTDHSLSMDVNRASGPILRGFLHKSSSYSSQQDMLSSNLSSRPQFLNNMSLRPKHDVLLNNGFISSFDASRGRRHVQPQLQMPSTDHRRWTPNVQSYQMPSLGSYQAPSLGSYQNSPVGSTENCAVQSCTCCKGLGIACPFTAAGLPYCDLSSVNQKACTTASPFAFTLPSMAYSSRCNTSPLVSQQMGQERRTHHSTQSLRQSATPNTTLSEKVGICPPRTSTRTSNSVDFLTTYTPHRKPGKQACTLQTPIQIPTEVEYAASGLSVSRMALDLPEHMVENLSETRDDSGIPDQAAAKSSMPPDNSRTSETAASKRNRDIDCKVPAPSEMWYFQESYNHFMQSSAQQSTPSSATDTTSAQGNMNLHKATGPHENNTDRKRSFTADNPTATLDRMAPLEAAIQRYSLTGAQSGQAPRPGQSHPHEGSSVGSGPSFRQPVPAKSALDKTITQLMEENAIRGYDQEKMEVAMHLVQFLQHHENSCYISIKGTKKRKELMKLANVCYVNTSAPSKWGVRLTKTSLSREPTLKDVLWIGFPYY